MRRSDEPDPLAEADEREACRCDGTGWVQVQEAYAEQHLAPDLFADPDTVSEQAAQLAEQRLAQQRAALAQSVYPCRVHNPRLFFRWAQGHLDPQHDRSDCPECTSDTPRRGGRRRVPAGVPALPERADTR